MKCTIRNQKYGCDDNINIFHTIEDYKEWVKHSIKDFADAEDFDLVADYSEKSSRLVKNLGDITISDNQRLVVYDDTEFEIVNVDDIYIPG